MPKQKLPKTAEKKPSFWRWKLETLKAQLVPLLLTGLIGLVIAFGFYVKAGNDMLRETKLLKNYNNMILTFMEAIVKEKQGKIDLKDIDIDFEKNEKGEIVGWKIRKGSAEMVLPPIKASLKGVIKPPTENEGKPGKPENPGQGQ